MSHELDVAYLLQNFGSAFSASSQELGRKMAAEWIDFAYREETQESEVGVLVIGPGDVFKFVDEETYLQKYRGGRGKLLYEIGWEKCFKLGEMLQGV